MSARKFEPASVGTLVYHSPHRKDRLAEIKSVVLYKIFTRISTRSGGIYDLNWTSDAVDEGGVGSKGHEAREQSAIAATCAM